MSFDYSLLIRAIAIPVSISLTFSLAKRYLPARMESVSSGDAIDSAGLSIYFNIATAVSVALIAIASFYTLRFLNVFIAHLGADAERVLIPDYVNWMFFPLFGGLSLGWELVIQIWSRFINLKQAQAYSAWSNAKTGFDSRRVLRWMTLLLALPVACVELMLLPVHDSFYADYMSIGRFAHFVTEDHPYSSVRTFETYQGFRGRDGSFTKQPSILLTFADGTKWTSWSTREDSELDQGLVTYLTGKIGHPPERRDVAR